MKISLNINGLGKKHRAVGAIHWMLEQ